MKLQSWALGLAALSTLLVTCASSQPRGHAPTRRGTPTRTTSSAVTDTWAVLIGVSEYQNDRVAGSLAFPAADASGIQAALVNPSLGHLAAGNVRLLTNADATRDGILSVFEDFLPTHVRPGDKVVVFLAGHGVTKGAGDKARAYFLPTDVRGTTTNALETSAVPLREIADRLQTLPASQFVIFMDACREDPTPGRGVKSNVLSDVMSRGIQPDTPSASSVTFFACGVGQRAFEDRALQHGVFTYWIIDGIEKASVPLPTGDIDMGRLATYVRREVENWAKTQSDSGEIELEQTPEIISSLARPEGVVLLRVKPRGEPLDSDPPTLTVVTYPEGARVSAGDRHLGAGAVHGSFPAEGEYKISVESPQFARRDTTITLLGGYGQQLSVTLDPIAGSAPGPADSVDVFQRGLRKEDRLEWDAAAADYAAVIRARPAFAPAYDRLSALQIRQSKPTEALQTAIDQARNAPSPHAYCRLALGYIAFKENKQLQVLGQNSSSIGAMLGHLNPFKGSLKPLSIPKDAEEAGKLALIESLEALNRGPDLAEPHCVRALAFMATDDKGKNRVEALAECQKAFNIDPKDPFTQYSFGYALRFYAVGNGDPVTADARSPLTAKK